MRNGLVFGKFLPFHKGHEALIDFAIGHCDRLTVLVCASDKESISGEIRAGWIAQTFPDHPNLSVRIFSYNERELPNTSESSKAVSEIWAKVFLSEVPEADVIFTSEPYGEFVASYMNIEHISFDPPRNKVPISATAIRNAPYAHWDFLPDIVRPFYTKKVAILGTESTGKTILANRLVDHFQAVLVPEAGREVIPDSSSFPFEKLYEVANTHANWIESALQKGNPLLVLDTDVHITQSYAQFFFEKPLQLEPRIYDLNRADLYLYLTADAPYVQDGSRLSLAERNWLNLSHLSILEENGISPILISGSWEERWERAVKCVEGLDK